MVELSGEGFLGRELMQLPAKHSGEGAFLAERLLVLAGLVRTIQSGELLAALPDCPQARERHIAAMTLLAMIEVEVVSLCQIYT